MWQKLIVAQPVFKTLSVNLKKVAEQAVKAIFILEFSRETEGKH